MRLSVAIAMVGLSLFLSTLVATCLGGERPRTSYVYGGQSCPRGCEETQLAGRMPWSACLPAADGGAVCVKP